MTRSVPVMSSRWLMQAIIVAVLVAMASALAGDGRYRYGRRLYRGLTEINEKRSLTLEECWQDCVDTSACLASQWTRARKKSPTFCNTYTGDSTDPSASIVSNKHSTWTEFVPPAVANYSRFPNTHVDGLSALSTHSMTLGAACAALCDADGSCTAFEVDYTADCILYESVDFDANVINQTRSTVFISDNVVPPELGCAETFYVEALKYAVMDPSVVITPTLSAKSNWRVRNPKIEHCIQECKDTSGCLSVNFFPGRRAKCYRYSVGASAASFTSHSKASFAYRCVAGCTDSNSPAYNADATQDDGSCGIPGCTDSTATNFDSTATIDDGSCITTTLSGGAGPTELRNAMFSTPLPIENPDYSASPVVDYIYHEYNNKDYSAFLHEDGTVWANEKQLVLPLPAVQMYGGFAIKGLALFVRLSDDSFYVAASVSNTGSWYCSSSPSYYGKKVYFPKSVDKLAVYYKNTIILYTDGSVAMCGPSTGGSTSSGVSTSFREVAPAGTAIDVGVSKDFSAYLTTGGDAYVSGSSANVYRCLNLTSPGFYPYTLVRSGVEKLVLPFQQPRDSLGFIDSSGDFTTCFSFSPYYEFMDTDVVDAIGSGSSTTSFEEMSFYLKNNGTLYQRRNSHVGEFIYDDNRNLDSAPMSLNGYPVSDSDFVPVAHDVEGFGGLGSVRIAEPPVLSLPASLIPSEVYMLGGNEYTISLAKWRPLSNERFLPHLPEFYPFIDPMGSIVDFAHGDGDISLFLDDSGGVFAHGKWARSLIGGLLSLPGRTLGDFYHSQYTLRQVPLPSAAVSIAVGYRSGYAVLDNGDLYGWGRNDMKQLCGMAASGGATTFRSPTLLATGVTKVAAYTDGMHYLTSAGEVFFCGKNFVGRAGTGGAQTAEHAKSPVLDSSTGTALQNVVDMSIGYRNSVFLTAAGDMYSSGGTICGVSLGYSTAVLVKSGVTAISTGWRTVAYTDTAGDTYMCGYNRIRTTGLEASPSTVNDYLIAGSGEKFVMTERDNAYILRTDGTVDVLCSSYLECGAGTWDPPTTWTTSLSGVTDILSRGYLLAFFT